MMKIPRFTAENALNGSISSAGFGSLSKPGSPAIEPQLQIGGGGLGGSCVDQYQNCYVDCSVKYPESSDSPDNLNGMYRQACFDSCDASYNLCSPNSAAAAIRWFAGRSGSLLARLAG